MPVLSEDLLEGHWFIVPKLNRKRWKNILHMQGYVHNPALLGSVLHLVLHHLF